MLGCVPVGWCVELLVGLMCCVVGVLVHFVVCLCVCSVVGLLVCLCVGMLVCWCVDVMSE